MDETTISVIRDVDLPLEQRVEAILKLMSLEEKVDLVHADSKFTSPGVPRLGIGPLWLTDGPHGVREEIAQDRWASAGRSDDYATYLPVQIVLAATWNPELAKLHGETLARECIDRGKQVILGPGLNVMRTPLNGRNFEYFGEDPFLISALAVAEIQGIQSQGVAACAKHFALNNQERERNRTNVSVSEVALRELYLPAFEAAVREGGVWTVMGAYNLYQGQHCCHNARLVNGILKGEWGFDGVFLSDWDGVWNTSEAVFNGMDLEMGTATESHADYYLGDAFLEGLKEGRFPHEALDDKVRRNLRLLLRTGNIDGSIRVGERNTPAHQEAARRIAEEGIVLLENAGELLPLDPDSIASIAVIGDAASWPMASEGGSSGVKALYERTHLDGLLRRVGTAVNIVYSTGYVIPDRLEGGEPDEAGVIRGGVLRGAGECPETLIERAVSAAREADVALVFTTLSHVDNQDAEGSDRIDLKLPWLQDELISRVAAVNRNTVVVLMCGGPVEMPWLGKVSAVLWAGYPGMEGGSALASIIMGDVCPSGKTPFTFPRKLADSPAHHYEDPSHYPGVENPCCSNIDVDYAEGLLVGYRWYDTKKIEPLFPFGFGLSYTRFEYRNASIQDLDEGLLIECEVCNVGDRSGAEVVQVYLCGESEANARPSALKGFSKIQLAAGEMRSVSIFIDSKALAVYDEDRSCWRTDASSFLIRIGSSSRDIRIELHYFK